MKADKLVKSATLSHKDVFQGCFTSDISRMYDLDGKFVTISDSGIGGHNHVNLSEVIQKESHRDGCDKDKVLTVD